MFEVDLIRSLDLVLTNRHTERYTDTQTILITITVIRKYW